jgi:hypothetical protein
MAQDDRGLFLGSGVTVCRMGGNLLMPGVDELDGTVFQGGQERNVGMTAEAEDILDPPVFQIFDQLMGNQVFHVDLRSRAFA